MILRRRRPEPSDPFEQDALPDVDRSQWWDASEIAEYQAARLRLIVGYAAEEIPFYRDWFRKHRVRASSIQGPDDLGAIPTIDRSVVQANAGRILNPGAAYEHAVSGGTTGHRLRWARTRRWLELFTDCLWRGFSWAGMTRESRVLKFYSSGAGTLTEDSLVVEQTFDITTIDDDLARMRAFRPEIAYVYASAAYVVGRYLIATGQTLPLQAVITSCEMLYPEHRRLIERAFECPVFDNYGCNDGGAWGAECAPGSGFHHDLERSVVEFVDGRMVATDLWNTAFPFIRYENGDAGRWIYGECSCGRTSPRFEIVGRRADLVVTPTRVVLPSNLNRALLHEELDDARVIQRSRDRAEILLVGNERFDDAAFERIRAELDQLLEGMELQYALVDRIPETHSGKHRVGINESGIVPDSVWKSPAGPTARG